MANSSPIWKDLPGLTACSLCAGETLGESDTEAGGQLQRLQRLAESGVARLTTVECLDLCECGDAVVARPTRASRGAAHGRCGSSASPGTRQPPSSRTGCAPVARALRNCRVGWPATSSSGPTRCPGALRRSRQHEAQVLPCPPCARLVVPSSAHLHRTFMATRALSPREHAGASLASKRSPRRAINAPHLDRGGTT